MTSTSTGLGRNIIRCKTWAGIQIALSGWISEGCCMSAGIVNSPSINDTHIEEEPIKISTFDAVKIVDILRRVSNDLIEENDGVDSLEIET